ncbi:hypothetical protein E5Q_01721 [Mixia osmundae IAM 14324]|uniref:Trafficking protein particle complex subunit 11 domain-containing protein n=1 Tax=Mixia osmundae (strain CBS 9802 / IAM 14324 / JCM 22182 / KY 12970) TaxID=764103 RepID=G7DWW9_MIXOS|nr:hypothetical protein E5Q_01721 [Mixia osmundae IAM 14324]
MSAARRLPVTYRALPSDEAVEPHLALLKSKVLPLTDLEWKSASRASRTIRTLEVDFRRLSDISETTLSGVSAHANLLERPHLHLLFVFCDDSDLYRSTARQQIREWLDFVTAKRNQEWIIISLSAVPRATSSKFYQRKGAVSDKIRADFNSGKRDRCVHMTMTAAPSADLVLDHATIGDLSSKLKDAIMQTFDVNLTAYEEEVRKKGLAHSFEAMNLLEDALIQYDELEASFFQTLVESNYAWLSGIDSLALGDDILPLQQDIERKPYRQLIRSNEITIFDFRIYLFSRQMNLLGRMGRIVELAKRSLLFIGAFSRSLRSLAPPDHAAFIESWTYSACISIVTMCDQLANSRGQDALELPGFAALRSELVELARRQLERLGQRLTFLPNASPVVDDVVHMENTVAGGPASAAPPISNIEFAAAQNSEESFDQLYIRLTHKAIEGYQISGRKRSSLRLHVSLALLERRRDKAASAQRLLSHLPRHYLEGRWTGIECALLADCALLQGELGMAKDKLLSTLALVRAGMNFGIRKWSPQVVLPDRSDQPAPALAAALMSDIYSLASTLEKDFAAINFPTFRVSISAEQGRHAQDEDAAIVTLAIESYLPCQVDIAECRLKFSDADGESYWFSSAACMLQPGKNKIDAHCFMPLHGAFALELSQLRFSRIIFQYSHRPSAASAKVSPSQSTVTFPPDPHALDVTLDAPEHVHLDRGRDMIVSLLTGRNALSSARIRLQALPGNRSIDLSSAESLASLNGVTASRETLQLSKVDPRICSQFRVPLSIDASDIVVLVDYYDQRKSKVRRQLRAVRRLRAALPFSVNVHDFFRHTFVLSRFAISSDDACCLRIRSATLIGTSPDIAITSSASHSSVVSPERPASYVFKINKPNASVGEHGKAMRFEIVYRSIEDEIKLIWSCAVRGRLQEAGLSLMQFAVDQAFEHAVQLCVDVPKYALTGHVFFRPFDVSLWDSVIRDSFLSLADQATLTALLSHMHRHSELGRGDAVDCRWRHLTIPVELPTISVLTQACLTLANPSGLELGQCAEANLALSCTFAWAAPNEQTNLHEHGTCMRYELNAPASDWIVCGTRMATFDAVEGVTHRATVWLISQRAGNLTMPSIICRPVDASLTSETHYINAATRVEVLPERETDVASTHTLTYLVHH